MKKTITGKEAFELLRDAVAYIIMDGNEALSYGEPYTENEDDFMYDERGRHDYTSYELDLSYTDHEAQGYEYEFRWDAEDEIKVEDNQIFLPELSGEITGIKLLDIKNI